MSEVTPQTSLAIGGARPGWFGEFGGRFASETLMQPLLELEEAFSEAWSDAAFRNELDHWLRHYVGRPTPLTEARRLSQLVGARVWLKREDLAHTGAHKINNAIGQALLARRMGKRRIIAETGAGQHGVATATACAALGLRCTIYMGEVDMQRQALNVVRMRLLGAEVVPATSGTKTLKDAVNEAMRDWVGSCDESHYILGSALGPHPFPTLVRTFHGVIGKEAREQMLAQAGALPDVVVACVGGGSNAIGIFDAFLVESHVALVGVEAGGHGVHTLSHASRFAETLTGGVPGVLHGTYTLVLQDEGGQVRETHSISAGLDYPAVGPEHAHLHKTGRARYVSVTDDSALNAFQTTARLEGILPALESAHAVAWVLEQAQTFDSKAHILINMSGRGDKDVSHVQAALQAREPA